MGRRREQRQKAALAVTIRGTKRNGALFTQFATTLDITSTGARLASLGGLLEKGDTIEVQRNGAKARFRVAWVGVNGTPSEGQAGIHSLEPGKYIWGVSLSRVMGDNFGEPPPPLKYDDVMVTLSRGTAE